MSTETLKSKMISSNGKSTNGASPKAAKRKKSINERWIEKYGVDDSETARKFRKLWKMVYDSHNQSKP